VVEKGQGTNMRLVLVAILLLAGCEPTSIAPPCVEYISILPGYEAQIIDSLVAAVPADSLWIKGDSTIALRFLPSEACTS